MPLIWMHCFQGLACFVDCSFGPQVVESPSRALYLTYGMDGTESLK